MWTTGKLCLVKFSTVKSTTVSLSSTSASHPSPHPRDLTMVPLTELQSLRGQFRNLPYQAISARLADVEPLEGDWKPEDTVWFNARVSDKQFVSVVKAVVGTGGEVVVALSLVDTSHPSEDSFISQELIQV